MSGFVLFGGVGCGIELVRELVFFYGLGRFLFIFRRVLRNSFCFFREGFLVGVLG